MSIFNKTKVTTTTTTTTSGLGNFSSWISNSGMLFSNSTIASSNWIISETLTEAQVKAVKHILRLRELSPTELTEMADTVAEHCGVTPEAARSALGVLKTLLMLGELQEKLER